MAVRPRSQNARILRVLGDGRWHSVASLHRRTGTTRLNSRISELRNKHGYQIEHERIPGKSGTLGHRYRLTNPPPEAAILLEEKRQGADALDRTKIPRDDEHRYRIYRQVFEELELVGTAPTPQDLGITLVGLGESGRFNGSCVGILDTFGTDKHPGKWLVQPFDTVPL